MSESKLKILVLGPARCGKTRLSNYLFGAEENANFDNYNPTAGVRILEFERNVKTGGQRTTRVQIELWDTSGDKKYESCWGAILRQAAGVIMVYDPTVRTQEKDIELWHKAFVQPLKLRDEQVVVLAHLHDAMNTTKWQPPRALDKFAFAQTSLDSDEGTSALNGIFEKFLSKTLVASAEKSKAEMEASLASAER